MKVATLIDRIRCTFGGKTRIIKFRFAHLPDAKRRAETHTMYYKHEHEVVTLYGNHERPFVVVRAFDGLDDGEDPGHVLTGLVRKARVLNAHLAQLVTDYSELDQQIQKLVERLGPPIEEMEKPLTPEQQVERYGRLID